jgi:large conductance mechanosensitive channel
MQKIKLGFVNFIREQGVMGLAIGFILGGSVQRVVSSLVNDIINPAVGILLKAHGNFDELKLTVNGTSILWGRFVTTLLDFVIISAVVYFVFKGLGLDRIDKKKQ